MIFAAIACLLLGVLVMVVLEIVWLGVILLFAFIVIGVFTVADPAFLAGSGGEDPD